MASISKKVKKGRTYYYAVECKRVGGKPRIVWQKYLGTIDAILGRAQQTQPSPPREAVIFDAGGVGALLRIAQKLGLEQLISSHCPKREQGPSVGQYMVLAALNRALAPCSKAAIGQWYEQTVLRRLWGFDAAAFSSQRFWDHMERLSQEAIESIQEQLVCRMREQFGIDSRILLYDTTNFFTFLATTNNRAQLPQRGRNKQKRDDLRQVSLSLLVTRDFHIPLLHETHVGNASDANVFSNISRKLLGHYTKLCGPADEATVVFDKGNMSDEAMENLLVPGIHFVGALPVNHFPELVATPHEKLHDLPGVPGTKTFSTEGTLCDMTVRFTLVYTESFFTQQLAGITTNLVKCQNKLLELGKSLEKWRTGKARGNKPTVAGVTRAVSQILSPQFMKQLFQIEITPHKGLPRLSYRVDHDALDKLSHQRLGRTLLVTDHLKWTEAEVLDAYRSLSWVEDAFRAMKNTDFLHWQPAYHWTDQKLTVHSFYCVLALLLTCLARKTAFQAGIDISLPKMLDELAHIREVAVIYPRGTLAHPKDHITLSRMTPRQRKLAEALDIAAAIKAG